MVKCTKNRCVAHLAHARHRVEAERRQPDRADDVVAERPHGGEHRLGDVVGARRAAQRARGRRGQPARVRLARVVVALVHAVELVVAHDPLLRDAVDLRLLHEHAREDEAADVDANAVHVVLVYVHQDAAQHAAPGVRLRPAAREAHGDLRADLRLAARVHVVVVHVGAHARAEAVRAVVPVVACAQGVGETRKQRCWSRAVRMGTPGMSIR